jgi:LysM repeat protein
MKKYLLFVFSFTLCTGLVQAQRLQERGLAEVIPNSDGGGQLAGVHRNLPIGKKVLVKNAANGRTVVVKIIGQLPKTGSNDKLLIKLSQQAYKTLNAHGRRFAVEITDAPKDEGKIKEDKEKTREKNKNMHEVIAGETLYGIALKYKVTVEQLKAWNELKTLELNVGQKLTIAETKEK